MNREIRVSIIRTSVDLHQNAVNSFLEGLMDIDLIQLQTVAGGPGELITIVTYRVI